jgi:hypothetical protein
MARDCILVKNFKEFKGLLKYTNIFQKSYSKQILFPQLLIFIRYEEVGIIER